jgi:hypothetical protein
MKGFVIRLLCGPALMALVGALGAPIGYYIGFIPACVILPIVAIAIGVVLAKTRLVDGMTAGFAAVLAVMPGIASAYGYHHVREIHTGDFVRQIALADVPTHRGTDRLTIRNGVGRVDLEESRSHTTTWGSASTRHSFTTTCTAYPIVPDGWTPADPVRVWRYTDDDHAIDRPLVEHVFHPEAPDELCRAAIDRVIARHDVRTADDPIYLEDMVSESADVTTIELSGPLALALLGGLWIVVVLYLGVRDGLSDWRRRRRPRSP